MVGCRGDTVKLTRYFFVKRRPAFAAILSFLSISKVYVKLDIFKVSLGRIIFRGSLCGISLGIIGQAAA
jgi:hypothetical protein